MRCKNNILSSLILVVSVNLLAASSLIQKIDSTNTMPYHYMMSHSYQAIKTLKQNYEAAKKINYRYGQAKALENLYHVYVVVGKMDKAIESVLSALEIYEELGKNEDYVEVLGRFAYHYRKTDIKKAKKYMQKAIRLGEAYKLPSKLSVIYEHYGVFWEETGNLDSAMFYYKKALDLKMALNDTLGIPFALNKMAGIYAAQGQFDKAFEMLDQSDVYRAKEKGDYGRALNLVLRAEFHRDLKQYQKAYDYFEQCLKLSYKIKYKDLIRYCYQQMAQLLEAQGKYQQALRAFQRYETYKDSLNKVETKARMAELEIAYETEKKDLLLAQKELKLKRRNILLIITLSLIGLLVTLTVTIYYFQKLKRERLRKELELQTRLKQSEMEKKLTEEKLRISRELHDNIGSHLTFMISSLDNLHYQIQENETRKKISHISQFGRSTMNELRNSIWAMKFQNGTIQDIVLKINEIKQTLKRNGKSLEIDIVNHVKTSYQLGSTQMLNIYRIVQEALQNIVKYANATKVHITFSENDRGFDMLIVDNGQGFDVNKVYQGNGLKNMQQRCEEIGGKWYLSSSPEGTVIRCVFHLA